MSGLPSFDRATASSRPFGAHAGAPLMPGNEVIKSRLPDVRSCTQPCERLFSNDTYARRLPSLAPAGDISGCGDCRITFGLFLLALVFFFVFRCLLFVCF